MILSNISAFIIWKWSLDLQSEIDSSKQTVKYRKDESLSEAWISQLNKNREQSEQNCVANHEVVKFERKILPK